MLTFRLYPLRAMYVGLAVYPGDRLRFPRGEHENEAAPVQANRRIRNRLMLRRFFLARLENAGYRGRAAALWLFGVFSCSGRSWA